MFDTMTFTKILGGFCGAFLIFLLGGFFGEFIYHPKSHGDDHHQAYTIDTGDDDHDEEIVATVDFAEVYAAADAGEGEKLFRQCKACHKVDDGAHGTGPSLYGVVGRDIASIGAYSYSGALTELPGDWTPEALSIFIENPKAYAAGTKMNYKGLSDVEKRANLIAYLDGLDG